MIGQRTQCTAQEFLHLIRHCVLGDGRLHTPEPLVPLTVGDCEGQVPRPQHRVPIAVRVQLRSTKPSGEIHIQFFPRDFETRGVQIAHLLGFGCAVHQIVKAVHESVHRGVATDE